VTAAQGNTSRMATAPARKDAATTIRRRLEDQETSDERCRRCSSARSSASTSPSCRSSSSAASPCRPPLRHHPRRQWEGDFGEFFDDAIKLEINLTKDGLEKIYRDYNENRIVPDFRPAGGKGDEDSARRWTACTAPTAIASSRSRRATMRSSKARRAGSAPIA
jgi:hypothetical protein